MVTRREFHAAYDAWKAATNEHKQMMTRVMEGESLNADRMHQQLAEIDRLHADWMRKAEPFVLRKPC